MFLHEIAALMGSSVEVNYHPRDGKPNFTAGFWNLELKDGAFLSSEYGEGPTPDEAVAAYCALIAGRQIVKVAAGQDRQVLDVPEVVEFVPGKLG